MPLSPIVVFLFFPGTGVWAPRSLVVAGTIVKERKEV